MILIRIFFLTFFISVLVFKGYCQNDEKILRLSVADAQVYALKNNRTVQSNRIDIDLANRKVWENLAQGLPQLSLNANYLHQFVVPEIRFGPTLDTDLLPDGPVTKENLNNAYKEGRPIPLGVADNTVIDLTLSQLIFSGQYIIALKTAKVVKGVTESALAKTEDLTKESVAAAYYQILVLRENIGLLNQSLKNLDQIYNELVGMNQQGLIEVTDVDQMNINRSNIKTLVNTLMLQEQISEKLLKYQLGIGFESEIMLTDSLPVIIEEVHKGYLTAPQFRLDQSVDYRMIGINEKISELLVKLEKSKFLPTVSAFYRHQEQTNQPSFNFAVKDVAGATLNFPLFASGLRSAKVSQAKYELEKIRLGKQDAEQGLIMEFETARNNYQTAFENYMVNRESLDLSRKVYDRTVIKYKEGVSASLELTQNQNQFISAESNYYNSLLTLLNAKAKLDRILRTE